MNEQARELTEEFSEDTDDEKKKLDQAAVL